MGSGRASIVKGSGEASSRRPVELVLAFYIQVMGLLILGVFSRSIVSKALRDLIGLGFCYNPNSQYLTNAQSSEAAKQKATTNAQSTCFPEILLP